jgi:hypothetical protein
VTSLWTGRRDLLFITVATADEDAGYALDKGSAVYRDLMKKLKPVHGAQVGSCVVTYFDVEISLTIDPGTPAEPIADAARRALGEAFSFDHRDLRQGVAASDIISVLTEVAGVRGARVRRPEGAKIEARDARWDEGAQAVVPAELLLINTAEGGIVIHVEEAT